MKKILAALLCLCCMAALAGCTITGNQTWEDLTPEQQQEVRNTISDATDTVTQALQNLRGSATAEDAGEDNDHDVPNKDLRLEIYDGTGATLLGTVQDDATLESLIPQSYAWPTSAQSTEGLTPSHQLKLLQESTLLLGEDADAEREYIQILCITLYEGSDAATLVAASDWIQQIGLPADLITINSTMPQDARAALDAYLAAQ